MEEGEEDLDFLAIAIPFVALIDQWEAEEAEEEEEEEEDFIQLALIFLLLFEDEDDNEQGDEDYEDEEVEFIMLMIQFLLNQERPLGNIIQALFPDFQGANDQGRNVFAELVQHPPRFWYLTGETPESFLNLFGQVWGDIARARNVRLNRPVGVQGAIGRTKLTLVNRLLLVMIWLRQYPTLFFLGEMFKISVTTVCDEIHHVIPILRFHLQHEIQWFSPEDVEEQRGRWPEIPNAVGALDCTIHRIERPTENQGQFYRGDKRCHFVNTLCICDTEGRIRHIEAGFSGHWNDTLVYYFSRVATGELQLPPNTFLLADGGFPPLHPLLIPYQAHQVLQNPAFALVNEIQRSYRSIIERVQGDLKVSRAVATLWRNEKERIGECIFVAGCLWNRRLDLLAAL